MPGSARDIQRASYLPLLQSNGSLYLAADDHVLLTYLLTAK